jgi:hypothetical protein
MALIGAPLSLLSYTCAFALWIVLEALSFIGALILILRHFGGRKAPLPVIITASTFLAWSVVFSDLREGQMMLLALLLLTGAWLALRKRNEITGGLLDWTDGVVTVETSCSVS